MKTAATVILCIVLGLLVFVPFFGAPIVTVKNGSATTVNNIELIGRGFEHTIAELPSGAEVSVILAPKGESGLVLQFVANDATHRKGDLAYFEPIGGYSVTIEITETLDVKNTTYSKSAGPMDSLEFRPSRLLHLFD